MTRPRPRLPLLAVVAAALLGSTFAWWLSDRDPCAGRTAAELEAVDARTPSEERCLGHALVAEGRRQAAVDAFLLALGGGEHDQAMLAFALTQAAVLPDARALALLVRWPDDDVDRLLEQALDREWPLRTNALQVLERRGRATDAHRQRVADRQRVETEPHANTEPQANTEPHANAEQHAIAEQHANTEQHAKTGRQATSP